MCLLISICSRVRAKFLVLDVRGFVLPGAVLQDIVLVAKPEAKEGWPVLYHTRFNLGHCMACSTASGEG